MSIDMSQLSDWLEKYSSNGPIAIITHKNGDMDTIGSGIVLCSAISADSKTCGIYMGGLAKKMLDEVDYNFFHIDPKRPVFPRTLAGLIIVDCASPSQVGFRLPDVPICVVDHHSAASDDWPKETLELIGDCSSTAEMIWEWMKLENLEPSPNQGSLLLSAIISDTGRFKHSRPGCHKRVSEISELSGVNPVDIIEKMESEDLNHSQRISIHKAVSRSKISEVGEFMVAITRAGTNEGLVAHALLSSGAHAAFVYKRQSDNVRLSARASQTATKKGIDLGKFMENLANRLGGEGGGHPGAAGWSGICDEVELESIILANLA
ncbi:MAG: hypothetical protein CMB18_01960 [Euryarchaeota archaeon]|nr:hypothetical protein [Euryarchaeota archaeon]